MRGREAAMAAVLLGAVTLVAVHVLLLHTYWDYSEGVYALTAQMMLHGDDLYSRIVGAQPPGVFLAGVGLLAIHNSVEWLRFGVGCLQLGAGLVAARIVYRVTQSPIATALTPAAMLLTPWAVHEHGALTPEMVALPVMLGAALLSAGSGPAVPAATPLGADRRRAVLAGVLCGLLPLIKVPLVIPAVALVALSADVRRTGASAAITLAVGLAVTAALGGADFWRDVFVAQLHSGSRSLGLLKGFWAQAGWNVLGLLFCAGVAIRMRAAARDRRLLVITIGLAVANLVTFLSNFKQGTGLNITVPVEASLVPLAACGAAFAFAAAGSGTRARWPAVTCALALAFTVAQSISLIAAPHNPIPFLRAFSAPAWEISMTPGQLSQAVAGARACPPGEAYSGPPLVALMAGRSLPAGQPDEFLPSHSSTLASVNAQIVAVTPVCPG